MHNIVDLAISIQTKQTFAGSKSIIRTQFETCSQLTIKDTRTTPLTSLILNIVNIDILNTYVLVFKLQTLNR